MIRRFLRHIRTKLILWHMLTVVSVVLLYSSSAAFLLFHYLREQLVRHAIQDLETVEGLLYIDIDRNMGMHEDYHNNPESKAILERLLEVRSPDGEVLYRNALLGNRSLGGPPFPGEGVGGYSPRTFVMEDGLSVQLVSRRHTFGKTDTVIRVAYSEAPLWERLGEVLAALLIPLPLVLVVTGFTGYLLAGRLLKPAHQMAQRAEQITGSRLHERLNVEQSDGEFAELAQVFNGMLARLEQSFHQLHRFTSDASHELRTPLAAMRSVGEVSLQKHATADEYRDIIGSMLEEANRLTRLVDSLLTIARADADQIVLNPSRFTAFRLVEECVSLLEVLVEEREQQIDVQGDRVVAIEGDWLLLRQALLNIIHNAIKHSPLHSVIRIEIAHTEHNRVVITVRDDGPGISEEDITRIFDRFYRVDGARSRDTGGVGLGLSITKWVIERHGGAIRAESAPGAGTAMHLEIPAARDTGEEAAAARTSTNGVARRDSH
jgi:heavy metal sensor kinase